MEENNLNAVETTEVVQPSVGAEGTEMPVEETAEPQTRDIDSMSDDDFAAYIQSAQEGNVGEVQADSAENAGLAEPDRRDVEGAVPYDKGGTDEQTVQPFKSFATQEEYQGEIDRIVSKRYGELASKNRADMERLEGLRDLAVSFYGGEGDAALNSLINDLREQNAEKAGVSAEEFDKQLRDSADARKYREQVKAQEEQQTRVQEIQQRWAKESEELKAVIPDFDFAKAMGNKAFYDNVINGMSVGAAYLAVNKAAAIQQQPQQQPKRRTIAQNGNARGANIGKVSLNVNSMTDEEFDAYISRLKG